MSINVTPKTYLRLDWWNSCDIGDKLYQTGYANSVYLAADVGKPAYELNEEAKKDGNENEIITFQNWKKKYAVSLLVPEYMLDALSQVRMHDNIWIYLQNGEGARIQEFVMDEPEWLESGSFATVNLTFTIASLIKAQCCDNMVLT